jgi:hypothetical protein
VYQVQPPVVEPLLPEFCGAAIAIASRPEPVAVTDGNAIVVLAALTCVLDPSTVHFVFDPLVER